MSEREPRMSVVIPAVRGGTLLADCLRALEPQAEALELEILVVSRLPTGEAEAIAGRVARTRTILAEGLTIPQMRAKGIEAAGAPVVAVLGEHVRPGPDWAGAMLRGHAASPGGAAVGGSIAGPERAGAAGLAAFLAEYSEHMAPMPAGLVSSLPGVNISYKRSAIEACGEHLSAGAWETFLHEALAREGFDFRCEAGAEVAVTRTYGFPCFTAEKFRIARSYAGMRASRTGQAGRIRGAAATVILPELLVLRIARRVVGRSGVRGTMALLRSLPFLLVYVAAWTLGELAGYLLGEGSSTARVT